MNKTISKYIMMALVFGTLCYSCGEDEPVIVEQVEYDPTPYALNIGQFPEPDLPSDNMLTREIVQLGRMLFYEEKLSKGELQSCASCHNQADAFTDTLQFSIGVEEMPGKRQAMSVFNMAWHTNEFFWDGRAHLLRDQAILPIQDPLEMNETLENVVEKLSAEKIYLDQFKRAFDKDEILIDDVALALEQFMLSIVSNDSKYDRYLAGAESLTESEERGRQLYFAEYNPFFPDLSGADCAHCHGGINFENDLYMNNGLDTDADFTDMGREKVTMSPSDRAKFKVMSLRNIEVTPPYMHDGRFTTLEEVVDHYNGGIQESSTVDPAILNTKETGLQLTDQDKVDLINFLKTLTDYTFLNNEEYSSPF
ncbi:MAG: cytochrome-c peroxidase [Saprospiraceae bacterium]|nr:cytochrome-c peroxidase [Saprospiraceae bacterium]